MTEIDKYIKEFQDMFDPKAKPYGSDVGERGVISRIMYNDIDDVFYYLHYHTRWFDRFGYIYHDRIPKEDWYKKGTSIPIFQLERAIKKNSSWIIICYRDVDYSRIWFFCDARKWYDYFKKYDTLLIKDKSQIDSIESACIPITTLTKKEKEVIQVDRQATLF